METKFSIRGAKWSTGKKLTCDIKDVSIITEENRELKFNLKEENPEMIEAILIRDSSILWFPLNLPKTFPYLTVLSINNCRLTTISKNDLIGFVDLVELDLGFNKLTTLPSDLFADTKKLKYIDFSGNQITSLDVEMFDEIKNKLERLDLRINGAINNTFAKGQSPSIDEFLKIVAAKSVEPGSVEKKSFGQKFMQRLRDFWSMLSRK